MKPFKVNRNSWHYKFNRYWFNEYSSNDWAMENVWEQKHNNFCAYWRATVLRIVVTSVLAFGLSVFLFLVGNIVYDNPWKTLQVIGGTLAGAAVFIGIVTAAAYADHRVKTRQKTDAPDSLIVAKYKSYKSKVCPMVEYDE